jgi:hypothetical protein
MCCFFIDAARRLYYSFKGRGVLGDFNIKSMVLHMVTFLIYLASKILYVYRSSKYMALSASLRGKKYYTQDDYEDMSASL